MRKLVLVLAALMVLCSGVAFASEGAEVEAGVKMWHNKWKNEDPGSGSLTFDAALLVGPAVEVKLPSNLFIEASYLFSVTDYEKEEGPAKLSAERDDLDVAVGYQFIPEAGVFVGYKSSSIDWTYTEPGVTDTGSMDLSGMVLGVRGSYSVNEMFGVYASAAYLMTKMENKDSASTSKEDAPGSVFELGVKAKFGEELSGTLGYKVESTKEDKTNIKDTFSGITLGVMYAF